MSWQLPQELRHYDARGGRTKGWEDLHVQKLSAIVKMDRFHLRRVLIGKATTTEEKYRRIAEALQVELIALMSWIAEAKTLNAEEPVPPAPSTSAESSVA